MKIIYNFTNIASHYRASLWSKLLNSNSFEFHFAFGKNKKIKIEKIDFLKPDFLKQNKKIHSLQNIWIKERILIFQIGVITKCLFNKIDMAIFLGEFQVISTWVSVIICKIRGIKIVYWTHGIYGNEVGWKRFLRTFFYKMADELLLYERRAKKLLIENGFKEEKLKVIYNSLDYDTHLELRNNVEVKSNNSLTLFKNNTLPYLIFVGRLTKVKRIDMLIEAVSIINKEEMKLNLLLVGDGGEKESLKLLTVQKKAEEYINFYGASYDEKELAKLIYHATLCVSPGNVGLTAIHSLSYGTPVCTHSSFYNQMPEVEVIESGVTGCFFDENSTESLANVILNWKENIIDREILRVNCYKVIDTFYNPYNQIDIIKTLL